MPHALMHHPFMDRLRQPRYADTATFLIRLAVGAIFVYHGHMKLFGGLAMTTGFFGKIGIPMPELFAPFIAGLEFFGGLLLILGLAVRPVGFLLACTMIVAILKAKGLSSWSNIELDILLLASSLSLLFSGAGACGVDAWLLKRTRQAHEASLPMVPKA